MIELHDIIIPFYKSFKLDELLSMYDPKYII